MKLKDALDNYYFHSSKASDIVRQLGLAGIAIIWIFKHDVQGIPKIPHELLLPLELIVLGLTFDLLQYFVAAIIWSNFHRCKEREEGVTQDTVFTIKKYYNWPSITFFYLKTIVIIFAYFRLLQYLSNVII